MLQIDTRLSMTVVPIVVTVVVAVLIRLIAGPGRRAPALAMPIAAVAAYVAVIGWRWSPPATWVEQIAWLTIAGGLAGLALDLATRGRVLATLLALVWPAVTVAMLTGFEVPSAQSELYRLGELSVVLGAALGRLHHIRDHGQSSVVTGSVIAGGLAALGWVTGAHTVFVLGLILASSGLGWILCNWPNRRLHLGAAGMIGWGGAIMALMASTALRGEVNSLLLLLVLAAVLVEPLARPLVLRNAMTRGEAIAPLALAVLVAIPGTVAVLLQLFAPEVLPRIW